MTEFLLVTERNAAEMVCCRLDGGAELKFQLPATSIENKTTEPGKIIIAEPPENGGKLEVLESFPQENIRELRLRDFEIHEVNTTEGNIGGPYDGGGRLYYLQGKDKKGTLHSVSIVPPHYMIPPWDLRNLESALMNVQIAQYEGAKTPKTRLMHEVSERTVYGFHDELAELKKYYKATMFPGGARIASPIDMATSLNIRSVKVTHAGPGVRAEMVCMPVFPSVPAKGKKLPPLPNGATFSILPANMLPYFEIDGKKVFIASEEPSRDAGALMPRGSAGEHPQPV